MAANEDVPFQSDHAVDCQARSLSDQSLASYDRCLLSQSPFSLACNVHRLRRLRQSMLPLALLPLFPSKRTSVRSAGELIDSEPVSASRSKSAIKGETPAVHPAAGVCIIEASLQARTAAVNSLQGGRPKRSSSLTHCDEVPFNHVPSRCVCFSSHAATNASERCRRTTMVAAGSASAQSPGAPRLGARFHQRKPCQGVCPSAA